MNRLMGTGAHRRFPLPLRLRRGPADPPRRRGWHDGGGDGNGDGRPTPRRRSPSRPGRVVTVVKGQAIPTLQYTAISDGQDVTAVWTIDRGELGTISGTGLFTPSGTRGGAPTSAPTTRPPRDHVGDGQAPAHRHRRSGLPARSRRGGYGGVGGNGPGSPATTDQQTPSTAPGGDTTVKLLYPTIRRCGRGPSWRRSCSGAPAPLFRLGLHPPRRGQLRIPRLLRQAERGGVRQPAHPQAAWTSSPTRTRRARDDDADPGEERRRTARTSSPGRSLTPR